MPLDHWDSLWLTLLIALAAALYASVGHGGASAYLAVMALFGVAPDVMKPSALVLNILVSSIALYHFHRAGCFDPRLFWPFAFASIPFALVGGLIQLPGQWFKSLVGIVLLVAALRLLLVRAAKAHETRGPSKLVSGFTGGVIGIVAGLTGTGGGIFLSPLLIWMHWADARRTAAVSAAFVLLNSVAALAGNFLTAPRVPSAVLYWAPAAVIGGLIGSMLGSRRLALDALRLLLALVLFIAAAKLILR